MFINTTPHWGWLPTTSEAVDQEQPLRKSAFGNELYLFIRPWSHCYYIYYYYIIYYPFEMYYISQQTWDVIIWLYLPGLTRFEQDYVVKTPPFFRYMENHRAEAAKYSVHCHLDHISIPFSLLFMKQARLLRSVSSHWSSWAERGVN